MSLSPEQMQAAGSALSDIERHRLGALATVHTSLDLFSGATAKNAAVYFLSTTVPNSLASLQRQLSRIDLDWQRWVTDADQLDRSIRSVVGDVSTWSLLGVLRATGQETAEDLGELGAQLPRGAAIGAGTFAFLGLLYVAWKVS